VAEHHIHPVTDDSSFDLWDHLQPGFSIGSPSIGSFMDDPLSGFNTGDADNAHFDSYMDDILFDSTTDGLSLGSVVHDLQFDPIMSALLLSRTPGMTLSPPDLKRTVESLDDVSKLAQLVFARSASNSSTHGSKGNIQTMHSYLQAFTLERHDGELLENIRTIFGHDYKDGLLQLLSYAINLLSNNLLSEAESDKIVQWVDQIQGHRLLTSLLSLNSPTIKAFASNLLASALRVKDASIARIILQAGANPNSPIAYSEDTPLQCVARYGSTEIARILLDAGADVNAPPAYHYGRTALQVAAETGNIELVRILLDADADVNALPACLDGRTALQAAAGNGNIELVQILVNAGADVNTPPADSGGYTALQAAAIKGHIRIAQLLLNANADVNAASAIQRGRTALEGAAEHGRIDMVQLLLNAGADTNSPQCTQYERAIELASKYGHDAVCGLLKAHHDRS
jgi:ankyrin repeat protein